MQMQARLLRFNIYRLVIEGQAIDDRTFLLQ